MLRSFRKRCLGFKSRRAFPFYLVVIRYKDSTCLDLTDCNNATELYAAVGWTSMYLHIPATYFCCCCSCCDTAVVASAGVVCLHKHWYMYLTVNIYWHWWVASVERSTLAVLPARGILRAQNTFCIMTYGRLTTLKKVTRMCGPGYPCQVCLLSRFMVLFTCLGAKRQKRKRYYYFRHDESPKGGSMPRPEPLVSRRRHASQVIQNVSIPAHRWLPAFQGSLRKHYNTSPHWWAKYE